MKRSPFEAQNESFWRAKRILLEGKTNPFGGQNEPFWRVKRILLESIISPFEKQKESSVEYQMSEC